MAFTVFPWQCFTPHCDPKKLALLFIPFSAEAEAQVGHGPSALELISLIARIQSCASVKKQRGLLLAKQI